eukprot:762820-Hanusia_phi.AAC.5
MLANLGGREVAEEAAARVGLVEEDVEDGEGEVVQVGVARPVGVHDPHFHHRLGLRRVQRPGKLNGSVDAHGGGAVKE